MFKILEYLLYLNNYNSYIFDTWYKLIRDDGYDAWITRIARINCQKILQELHPLCKKEYHLMAWGSVLQTQFLFTFKNIKTD